MAWAGFTPVTDSDPLRFDLCGTSVADAGARRAGDTRVVAAGLVSARDRVRGLRVSRAGLQGSAPAKTRDPERGDGPLSPPSLRGRACLSAFASGGGVPQSRQDGRRLFAPREGAPRLLPRGDAGDRRRAGLPRRRRRDPRDVAATENAPRRDRELPSRAPAHPPSLPPP